MSMFLAILLKNLEKGYMCMSSEPLEKGLSIDITINFVLRPTLFLDMLGTKGIETQLQSNTHIFEEIRSLGASTNIKQFLVTMQMLKINYLIDGMAAIFSTLLDHCNSNAHAIHCNRQMTMLIFRNLAIQKHSKHIGMHFHFMSENVVKGFYYNIVHLFIKPPH